MVVPERMLFLSFICIILLLPAEHHCGCQTWRPTNPGGGGALNSPVVISNRKWAVGSDLSGVYVTKNRGKAWTTIGASQGLNVTHVSSMAATTRTTTSPQFLLVGTEEGIYYGRIGNFKTFRRGRGRDNRGYVGAIVAAAPSAADAAAANSIAYAVVHPSYRALGMNVLRSIDDGKTWKSVAKSSSTGGLGMPPNDARVVAMRAHPTNPDKVWMLVGPFRFNARSTAGAYRSVDGGTQWFRRDPFYNSNDNNQDLEFVDVAYVSTDELLCTTIHNGVGTVWRSRNDGITWNKVAADEEYDGGITGVILADGSDSDHWRLIDFNYRSSTTETLLWETLDGGTGWNRLSTTVDGGWSGSDEDWGMGSSLQSDLQTIGASSVAPDDAHIVLWSTPQFVYKSLDGGHTWRDAVSQRHAGGGGTWSSRGLDNIIPIVLAPSRADENLMYVGYMDLGIWRSDNIQRQRRKTWRDLNPGARWTHNWGGKGGNTLTVAADPDRPDVVWAMVAGDLDDPLHVLRSNDRGETWRERSNDGLPANKVRLDSLEIAPDSAVNNRWIYVVCNGNVFLSENDGASWGRVLSCGDCVGVRYTLYAGVIAFGPSGIWQSYQGGTRGTWNRIVGPGNNGNTMSVSDWTPGLHWHADHYEYVGPVDLAWRDDDDSNAQVGDLWIAVKGMGLYHSDSFGRSWSLVYETRHARSVAYNRFTGQVLLGTSSALYAGGYERDSQGLLVHPDGTGSGRWVARNDGLAWPFVTFVTVDAIGGVWIISPGQGVMFWDG